MNSGWPFADDIIRANKLKQCKNNKFINNSQDENFSASVYMYTVICLMVLIAVASIVWSVSLHLLSGDFYHGLFGAKIVFRERDFEHMSNRMHAIFQQDLDSVMEEVYIDVAYTTERPTPVLPENTTTEVSTAKPKVRKIAHLFQTSANRLKVPDSARTAQTDDDEAEDANATTARPASHYDVERDKAFIANMTVDRTKTRWHHSTAIQFAYGFPFMSELVAIIWTAMCLIYQAGVKKYWGLPKPWRIVLPSIVVFTLMSLSSVVYTIVVNGLLKSLCHDLRQNLTNPNVLSCGQAMTVLRPVIVRHEFRTDVYLNLFRISYLISLVAWILALLVMVMRYVFAIDFQLVDVQTIFESRGATDVSSIGAEYTEVLLNSPKHQANLLQVNASHKSEDDFQSAKSHASEFATPLLEQQQTRLA